MNERRPSWWAATGHSLGAAVVIAFLAMTTTVSATLLSPTTPAVPVPSQHLNGLPEALHGQLLEKRTYVPSLVSCHIWPGGAVTQTFDPHSPACVSTWDFAAGNGGSTAPGVEGNLIQVGVPTITPELTALVSFFNTNYQFYGRSLQLVAVGQNGTPPTLTAMIAQASAAKVFAVMGDDLANDLEVVDADRFISGLAKAGIVGVVGSNAPRWQSTLTASGPYGWSVFPAAEVQAADTASAVCRTLKGGVARFSGGYRDMPRKFAVLTASPVETTLTTSDTTKVHAGLTACGIKADLVTIPDDGLSGADPDQLTALMARLKQGGYTTLVAHDMYMYNQLLLPAADAAAYEPEWFFGAGWSQTSNSGLFSVQSEHTIGSYVADREPWPVSTGVAYQALASTRTVDLQNLYTIGTYPVAYRELALLAAGIQAAGPRLTPQTFAAGLESAHFPDPQAGPPTQTTRTGFQLGDHTMLHGTWLVAYKSDQPVPGVPGPDGKDQRGMLCPVADGRRFDAATPYPTGDSVYTSFGRTC